jgi:hypothetical protein
VQIWVSRADSAESAEPAKIKSIAFHPINHILQMAIVVKGVMEHSSDFFENLPVNACEKLNHLHEQLHLDPFTKMSYAQLERVTMRVMDKKGNDDRLFLYWLHYVGYYIKAVYGGEWYLRKVQLLDFVTYYPMIVNSEGRVWTVGEFCWKTYFVRGKLKVTSFKLFYTLNIQQFFGEPHISNFTTDNIVPLVNRACQGLPAD